MFISDNYHLTYCTNIHPGSNWKITFEHLKKNLPEIKQAVSPHNDFGVGLRLSNTASEELGMGENLVAFKTWLREQGLYVFTMNGFPYGNFHHEAVKAQVHHPDWTTEERKTYTLRLFDQLQYLLPKGVAGGISTSPVSYKHWHDSPSKKEAAFTMGAEHMITVALALYEKEQETGQYLHLDIEPEPDGLLENTAELLAYFADYLVPIGQERFRTAFGLAASEAEKCIKRYLTLCYDVCHFSLAFEPPEMTFTQCKEHRIAVGKIQVSSALKIINRNNVGEIWQALRPFDEPTYLHQVTENKEDGVVTYADLPVVLNKKTDFTELRAHFHVPIFLESFGILDATQDQIIKVLAYLANNKICEHLEIETYTWDVLPEALKMELTASIIREVNWLAEKL